MKKIVVLVFWFFALGTFASTVSLSVVQNENAPDISKNLSHKIEGVIMDTFFDMGEIVTNDTLKFDSANFSDVNYGIKQALDGMADYLLVVNLEYDSLVLRDTNGKEYPDLQKITYRLVKLSNKAILEEKTVQRKQFLKIANSFTEISSQMAEYVARESYKALLKSK